MQNTLTADLVTFYTVRSEYCGVAWVNYPALARAYAYSVINADCQGTFTLAHELGHNMGLFYDRYVEPNAPASQFNYGYVDPVGGFRTIMSYPNECADRSVSCSEVGYYSTPLKYIAGRPLGIAKFSRGAADSARLLRHNSQGIADFR